MMMGHILAAARNGSGQFQQWLLASEPALAKQVHETAAENGMTPTGYVRAAVADFTRFASEEDWATLTSSMRDSEDPGTVCLLGMVHWRLTAAGCQSHSHQHHHGASQ